MDNVKLNILVDDKGISIESEGSTNALLASLAFAVNMLSEKTGIPIVNLLAKLSSNAYDIEFENQKVCANEKQQEVFEETDEYEEDITDNENCEIIPIEFWFSDNTDNLDDSDCSDLNNKTENNE